jgi:hypothetical protein
MAFMRKNMLFLQKVLGLLAVSLAVVTGDLAAATAADYETPPVLGAGDVLSDGLLRSTNHQVLDEIHYDGYLFQFELETDYGSEVVTSKALLKIRVHEATVIAAASTALLQRTKLTESGMAGQPGGRDYLSARSADPRDDLGGEVQFSQIKLSGKKKTSPKQPAGDSVTDISHGNWPPGSDLALDANKRAIAARLQMDVYTSNEVAQDLLNKLARARTTGAAQLGAGFIVERDPETKLANDLVAADVRRALKDNTRDELRELNDRTLASLMIPAELRQRFLEHPAFSPRHQAYIVAYLEQLGGVEGRESFLLAALAAENETQALFYEQWARMLAVYDEQVEALVKLSPLGSTVAAHTQSGVLVLVQPVDIVYWSEHFDLLTANPERLPGGMALPARELVVTGMVTAAARRELEGRGYTVRDKFLTRR